MTFSIRHIPADGDDVVFIHGFRDLKRAAADWGTFSNDVLGRIQIPGEDKTRPFRQCPIEFDPPTHGAYRAVVQPMFDQPLQPSYIARIEALVTGMVEGLRQAGTVEVFESFALPLQSSALTHLLGMPLSEADLWVSWGRHVFRSAKGDDLDRAGALIDYLKDRLTDAPKRFPGSMFAHLSQVEFQGRPLTEDEKLGFAHLVFAGGRDTVIKLVGASLIHFARNPDQFARLKADPALAVTATEELVRYLSPLTYLGRVCPHGAQLGDVAVAPGQRVALMFADANRDPGVFADPDELRIDRRPNPHVGFGTGPHTCPGSTHARLLSRTVLQVVARLVPRLEPADPAAPPDLRAETMTLRFG
jgi:cytochrome P450